MAIESSQFPAGILVDHHDGVRPIDWSQEWKTPGSIHLEIGFGLGEFLIRQSELYPDEHFVGLELAWPRIYRCLQRITALRQTKSQFGDNIRILKIDVHVALERLFRPKTIDRVTCLFPCPWPKKSHIKHRLFSRDFLCLLNSRLKDGAAVKIVTDWQPYFQWVMTQLEGTGFKPSSNIIDAQFGTKFERKWREGGQEKFWELVLQKVEHCDVAVLEDYEMKVHFLDHFEPQGFKFDNYLGQDYSIVFKDFFFDAKEQKGLIHLIVAEKFLTQHVWAAVVRSEKRWFIAKAEGHSALPTSAVAKALELTFEAAQKSAKT